MSLQLILGNSGSGKSEWLYRRVIKEATEHPERSYVVIVPEQFSMQTQRELVRLSPVHGILNIDVLSFPRLAHRVFEETGSDQRPILTETGKNLMIRALSIRLEKDLPVFGSRMNQAGYVSGVKSMLSELMQYEVSEGELSRLVEAAQERPLLQAKLKDIRMLYHAYLEDQRDRLLKPEELLDLLCRSAARSDLIRDSVFAVDCFTGFTPSQRNVLEELMTFSKKVYVTVTAGSEESWTGEIQEHELFALSKKTIRLLLDTAEKASLRSSRPFEILSSVILGKKGCPRFISGGEIAFLERHLFRKEKMKPWIPPEAEKKPDGEGDQPLREGISLHEAACPADEVLFAARTIAMMLKSGRYRCREIAIITGNPEVYESHIRRIFDRYEIPVFLDETRKIVLNPCLEFVKAAIGIVRQNFSTEAVIRLLRTGMILPDPDTVDRLENFLLAVGIHGPAAWENRWTDLQLPGRFLEEAIFCEESRKEFADLFLPFFRTMTEKGKTAGAFAEALYDLMAACSLQQKLADRQKNLENSGKMDIAGEYSQIYGIVLRLLDEMVDLLGDRQVSLREFEEILDAGFAEARVGLIPPGIDEVHAGDMERSRMAHVRCLFFLGMNDGWVPAHSDAGGILSDMEREILKDYGADLAPSAREESCTQRFYLYQNLTKAGERLALSWSRNDSQGNSLRPSYVIGTVRRMFPHLAVEYEQAPGEDLRQVISRRTAVPYLTGGLREARFDRMTPAWKEVYRIFMDDPKEHDKLQMLTDAAFRTFSEQRLLPETAHELYGDVLENSVTRLEQFSECPFEHYVSYGLRLKERELHEVRAADLGTIFHRSLERYARQLEAEGLEDWTLVDPAGQGRRIDRCVEEAAKECGGSFLFSTARDAYILKRAKRILRRSVWALTRQIAAGRFVPSAYEVAFGDFTDADMVRIRLSDGSQMHLTGRIDRIDRFETEDSVCVKIIDYKSGIAKFDPASLYFGLQLQLMTYLDVALSIEKASRDVKKDGRPVMKRIVPAGVLYYHLADPLLARKDIKEAADDPKLLEEKIMKNLRPDGVVNQDPEVLKALDTHMAGDSLVIPVGRKKNGELKAVSSVLTSERFEAALSYTRSALKKGGERIRSGEIAVSPYRMGRQSACDFCLYGDICDFDRKIPGTRERVLPKLADQEVWKRIENEAEGNETADKGE